MATTFACATSARQPATELGVADFPRTYRAGPAPGPVWRQAPEVPLSAEAALERQERIARETARAISLFNARKAIREGRHPDIVRAKLYDAGIAFSDDDLRTEADVSGPANKPQGLTFDDVATRRDVGALTAFLRATRHAGSLYHADEMAGVAAASPLAKQGGHINGVYLHPQMLFRDLVGGAARLAAEKIAPSVFGQQGGSIYDKTVAEERARFKEAEEQYPKTTFAGDLVGGLALPVGGTLGTGAKLGARMLQGTKLGALLGAISGAGRGEDLSGRAFGAAIGAPLGAAVGGAAPVLIKGVEKVGTAAVRTAQPFVNAILERRSPEAKLVTARMTRAKRSANDGATVPSEEVNLFHPPKVRRRYEEDYPDGGQADARGNLLYDIDGYPLPQPHEGIIVGRQTLRGRDIPLKPSDHDLAAWITTNRRFKKASSSELDGALGDTEIRNGLPYLMRYLEGLLPHDEKAVKTHELGHSLAAHIWDRLVELTRSPSARKEMSSCV